ncbi:MAG: hypothetical protein MUC33_13160 [Desulfobacterales bacterium]|jgi:hypothetical protein|nr:hypothetical protein [Desulfobacterales bacterium]
MAGNVTAGGVLGAWVGRCAATERRLPDRAASQETTRLPASIPSGLGA